MTDLDLRGGFRWVTRDSKDACSFCERPAGVFRTLTRTDKGWVCTRERCRAGTTPVIVTRREETT